MAGHVLDDEPVGAAAATFDVYWDASTTAGDGAAAGGAAAGGTAGAAGVPAGLRLITRRAGEPTSDALRAALRDAAADRRGLAVISGEGLPDLVPLAELAPLDSLDPLVASVQPRFASRDSGEVFALPVNGASPGMVERADLEWLSEVLITPELPSAVVLLTPAAVRAIAPRAAEHDLGLAELLTALRRLGFRNIVSNRVVVDYPGADPYAVVPDARPNGFDASDINRGRTWLAALADARLDRILAGAYRDGRARLLLDGRHMPPTHNGTSHAILGILDGFAAAPRSWDVELVASAAAIDFHDLRSRYPVLHVVQDVPDGNYLAAVHLTQPWLLGTFADLHERAVATFFYLFDTIAWDIIYPAPDNLDAVWRFAGAFADGLIFDSEFTQARFERRFGVGPGVATTVARLSLAVGDYQVPAPDVNFGAGPDIVVIGNSYDHKDVDRAARVLAAALPECAIVALGGTDVAAIPGNAVITNVPSGNIDDRTIETLQASARVIVYPSFYEGFGLPVPFGLANGRTVVVRESELWLELADHMRMPGSLVTFGDDRELVDVVRRCLAGMPVDSLPQGRMLTPSDGPPDWRACADRILAIAERTVVRRDGTRWRNRDVGLSARDIRKELEDSVRETAAQRDALAAQLRTASDELQAVTQQLTQATEQLAQATDQRDAAERELAVMRGTISWRITTPLRRARQWMRQRGISRP